MESLKIEQLELIILVGAVVAIITRRLKIPYTAGLVVAGILMTLFSFQVSIPFNKDIMFDVLLPPLIFEAALYIRWKELQRDLRRYPYLCDVGFNTFGQCMCRLYALFGGMGLAACITFRCIDRSY